MSEPLKALVADRNTTRGRANARALAEAGVSSFLLNVNVAEFVSGSVQVADEERSLREFEFPDSFDFVLLHNNDRESFWWTRIQESWGSAMPVIFRFTGGQPPDEPRWLRALRSDKDALTQREVQAITGWVAKGATEGDRPTILRINRDDPAISNLSALVILCQAYLAVHIDRRTQRPVLPEAESVDLDKVLQAVSRMGWPSDWRGPHDAIGKRRDVRQTGFWLAVFPCVGGDTSETFGESLPKEAAALVAVFQDSGTFEVPAGVVAAAYLALAELP